MAGKSWGTAAALGFVGVCVLLARGGGTPDDTFRQPQMCAQSGCHTGFALNLRPALLSVTGFPQPSYTPGAGYDITVTVSANPNVSAAAARAGFTAYVSRNADTPPTSSTVGTLAATDPGTRLGTHVSSTLQAISYVTHTAPRGGGASTSFTFRWTAPSAGGVDAVLVVASTSADGDGTETGDYANRVALTAVSSTGGTSTTATTASSTTTTATTTSTSTTSTTLPPGTPARLFFSQIGNGGGTTSELVLANPSTERTVAGRVDFFDDDGLPLRLSLVEGVQVSVEFVLQPLAVLSFVSDGRGPLSAGSADITSDAPLGGVVRFRIEGIGTAGVGQSQPLAGFIVPVRRSGGINAGVALRNVEGFQIVVIIVVRDKLGRVTGESRSLALPAHGHIARFIDELVPAAEADFEGTISVQVAGPGKVAGVALELGSKPGEFTTLPVIPLANP